jgi:hypothetical protein
VYVEPFVPILPEEGGPRRSGRWQITGDPSGGTPRWSADGTKLVHLTFDRRLVAADVDVVGETIRIGATRGIFQTNAASNLRAWDMVPGTDRIVVINQATRAQTPITAVIGLRKLLAEAER